MSFEELHLNPAIVARLTRAGYHQPTPIQAQAIPTLLAGRDVIGLAPTGTGKTCAYIAPMVEQLLGLSSGSGSGSKSRAAAVVRGLVITPTRELAEQVSNEAIRISGGLGVKFACVFGGVGMMPQVRASQGADVVVGTPGRLRELVDAGHLQLGRIAHLVVDEADRLLDMGFLPQVKGIVSGIPGSRQTALFTATMPDQIEKLCLAFLRNPVRIEIGEHTRTVEHVRQRLFPVADHLKVPLLLRLLSEGNRQGVLIFARTRRRVGWVAAALRRNGIDNAAVHGDRTQAQRRRALEQFKNGKLRVIVATDVAARGLHIDAVQTVINYDLPVQAEEFVHRTGRAGHGGAISGSGARASGEAITLITPEDRDRWRVIESVVKVKLETERLDGFDYDEPRRGSASSGPRPKVVKPRAAGAKSGKPKKPGSRSSSEKVPNKPGKKASKKRSKNAPRGPQTRSEKRPPKPTTGKLKRRHRPSRPLGGEGGDDTPGSGVRKLG